MKPNREIRVVFMGTPDFAVPILDVLYKAEYNIVKIFTNEDKPVGRKQIITSSPVKCKGLECCLDICQPKNLKNEDVMIIIKDLKPDIIIVAAYGCILPASILNIPKFGCINVHGSLLPKYRGAAPIQQAIINGEQKTGITIMLMDSGIDTGDMLSQQELEIDITDTTLTLSNKLAQLGAELLINTLANLINNKITPIPQDNEKATYAPRLKKNDGLIDWSKKASNIYNLIRGVEPWPEAYTFFKEKALKIKWGNPIPLNETHFIPGQIIEITKENFKVACGHGAFIVTQVQPEGKKIMTTGEFIRGYRVNIGEKFTDFLTC